MVLQLRDRLVLKVLDEGEPVGKFLGFLVAEIRANLLLDQIAILAQHYLGSKVIPQLITDDPMNA